MALMLSIYVLIYDWPHAGRIGSNKMPDIAWALRGALKCPVLTYSMFMASQTEVKSWICCPRLCLGSLWVPWLPPKVQRHASGVGLIGDSKLSVGVNVSVCGSLSLNVSTVMNCQLVWGVPCLHPMSAAIDCLSGIFVDIANHINS